MCWLADGWGLSSSGKRLMGFVGIDSMDAAFVFIFCPTIFEPLTLCRRWHFLNCGDMMAGLVCLTDNLRRLRKQIAGMTERYLEPLGRRNSDAYLD